MTNQAQGVEAHSHFLSPGCLGPYLDKFTAELTSAGYKPLTISDYMNSVAHFGTWMHYKRIAVTAP